MVGIAFFFEESDIDIYSGREIDLDAWHLASQIAEDVTEIIVINRTNKILKSPNADKKFSAVSELPDLPRSVYLDPNRGKSLWEIDHSKIDWYVIGPADGWDSSERDYIHIPQSGGGHCHSQHIATVVMFDRHRCREGNHGSHTGR